MQRLWDLFKGISFCCNIPFLMEGHILTFLAEIQRRRWCLDVKRGKLCNKKLVKFYFKNLLIGLMAKQIEFCNFFRPHAATAA